jgi:hypothetical protein
MKRKDSDSGWLAFADSEPEVHHAQTPEVRHRAALIVSANTEVYNGFRNVISSNESFTYSEEAPWPATQFITSGGIVQVQLRPVTDEPLLPEEQDEIANTLFEKSKHFSEIEADVSDILISNWLKLAKDQNHRAVIESDEFCRRRGLKPKLSGQGRRGGYTQEQRLVHLNAANSIFNSWIVTNEAPLYRNGKVQRIGRRLLESRPFVVTDRVGDHRFSWLDPSCRDNCVDVLSFKYVVGEVFGSYLMANRQTALLSEHALHYSAKEWREKRLTRYFSHLWRIRARKGDFSSPIRVSTIFKEGLRLEIDPRRLSEARGDFVNKLRKLHRDAVIAGWNYECQDGPWPDWTLTIEPPLEILQHYAPLKRGYRSSQRKDLPPIEQNAGKQIRVVVIWETAAVPNVVVTSAKHQS